MQIDAQEVLTLAEVANKICFFDLETTGLHGDYNSVLVGAIRPWTGPTQIITVTQPGDDRRAVQGIRDILEQYVIWVSYYGKLFDVPLLQARLLRHRMRPLEKRHHLDLYWLIRGSVLTSRRSQAHLLEWLGGREHKMTIGADEWNRVLRDPAKGLRVLSQRCDSDTIGLRALYKRSKRLVVNVNR